MSGLYLHIPFCRRKCPYCDFFSVAASDEQLEIYPDLLIKHLRWASKHGWIEPFETIYFGGGTPSLLAPTAIADILEEIDRIFGIPQKEEITLEANPGTVSQQTLEGYRHAGVNRLSLGLQSCNDEQLANLGRLHNRQEGFEAFKAARNAGFDNISLDLMFALAKQTKKDLEDDLNLYLDLAPEHLSCYGLTVEEGTPFHLKMSQGKLRLPDEDFYADAFMLIHDRLTAAGYNHYEISNYARQGHSCRHNLGYWKRQPYLGVGPGAHSFWPNNWGSRREVPADLTTYQQGLHNNQEPTQHLEEFDRDSALRETIYLALRTQQGVSDKELKERFRCTLQSAFPEAVAANAQWLTEDNSRWSFSPSGWLLFDSLILAFL